MISDEIESVETTAPIFLEEQTEQITGIFPQVFGEAKLILIQLRARLDNILGK